MGQVSLTLSDIRAAIEAQLANNIDKQLNIDTDGRGKAAPESIKVQLQQSDPIDYWVTMSPDGAEVGGVSVVRFDIFANPANNDRSAVARLDALLSVGTGNGSSIIDALMADKTLGTTFIETIRVTGVSEYDAINVTATLPLEVVCRKQGANS